MITINGKSYEGTSISVTNGHVVIDGVEVTDNEIPKTILHVEVKGSLHTLTTDASVDCDDITGNVTAGGSVNCDDIGGDVKAGGSVNCDDIGGSIEARGSVNHG